MARVSVIIPCYNSAATLQETLDSVYAQTHDDIEIILVNDGSTDATADLIAAQGDRVRALHGPNRGAAGARNAGTALAGGDFIQYLDADDLLAPTALADRLAALAGGGDLAYGDWQRLVETAPGQYRRTEVTARVLPDDDPELAVFRDFWSPPAALLYRRALVARVGDWRQDLAPIEDAAFLQAALRGGARCVHVPGVSVWYRVPLALSHSRVSPVRFTRAVAAHAFEVEAHWRARGLTPARQQALADCYGLCARKLLRHDRDLFRAVVARHRVLDARGGLPWPRLAGLLSRLLGARAAAWLLAALGRPAE